MLRPWIVNASPTILLCKIGQVNLLHELSKDLIIPSGVAEEISRGGESDTARRWLEHEGSVWIRETGLSNPVVAAWGLGLGETQVLSYTLAHRSYVAIVDDRAARNCALSLQIPVRGTLGVLLLAKQVGKIEQVKPLVRQLQQAGLRLEMKLVAEVIRLAGE